MITPANKSLTRYGPREVRRCRATRSLPRSCHAPVVAWRRTMIHTSETVGRWIRGGRIEERRNRMPDQSKGDEEGIVTCNATSYLARRHDVPRELVGSIAGIYALLQGALGEANQPVERPGSP